VLSETAPNQLSHHLYFDGAVQLLARAVIGRQARQMRRKNLECEGGLAHIGIAPGIGRKNTLAGE